MNKKLIAISGKINSGKDTVGFMISYLKSMAEDNLLHAVSLEDFELNREAHPDFASLYEIHTKKFADKLKEIVALLLGCTREQLEDREYKETELGEEWWYYKGETQLFPYNTPYEANKKLPLIKLTPRLMLQLLGSEAGRGIIHPEIWVNALFSDYKPDGFVPAEGYKYFNAGVARKKSLVEEEPVIGVNAEHNYPEWIITDCRFPNEAEAVKSRGGLVFRVERPGIPQNDHISETALDDYENFDQVIINDGNINDLLLKVKTVLEHYGII